MKIPFLHFFRKEKAAEAGGGVAVAPPPPPVRLEKPASERFGKTVLPNVSRFVGIETAANFPLTPAGTDPGSATGNLPVGFASPGAPTTAPAARRISLGANGSISTPPSPLDETTTLIAERKIALALADLLPQIAPDLLNPQAIDPERRLLFRAAELERGMSSGQPCASLRAIYQQAPELFTREVAEADSTKVALPFGKVLEQFANFQVRADQVRDENLPQLETPFLHVALEDGERFATTKAPKPDPVAASKIPAAPAVEAKVAPAASAAVVDAPGSSASEPVAGSAPPEPKRVAPIRLPIPPLTGGVRPGQPAADAASSPGSTPPAPTAPPTPAPTSAPAPIRLTAPAVAPEFSPNGTGAPASERVPASSGQPVPTPLPSPFAPLPLARIPMKVTPPANDLREPAHPQNWSLRPAASGENAPPLGTQKKIRLPLRDVLAAVPPFQLSGPPLAEVPESAVIEFPLNLIKPQLSLGRVEVTPAQFQAALPGELRDRFQIEDTETPIPLPLPQVLQNLPNETLQMRGDQEESEVGAFFETPFSEKAAEDATRMKGPSGPIGKPGAVAGLGAVAVAGGVDAGKGGSSGDIRPESPTPATAAAAAPPAKTEPQIGEPLDAKAVVAEASRLPGVQACAVVFSDGLGLAGNIPPDFDVDALCAMAPTIMKRIDAQMASAKLGALAGITLFCAKAAVTFFAHGNICLAALHRSDAELTSASRSQLGRVTEALARTYRPPA